MRRVPLVLATIVLTLLLVDSVMHDPNVHPFAEREFRRVRSTALSMVDRLVTRGSATPARGTSDPGADPANQPERTHSPTSYWYWSTIAIMAGVGIWLLKMAVTVTFRNRSGLAAHDQPLPQERRT